jgi:hypothetical protein
MVEASMFFRLLVSLLSFESIILTPVWSLAQSANIPQSGTTPLIGPIITSILASITTFGVAVYVYRRNKPKLDLEVEKLTEEIKKLKQHSETNTSDILNIKDELGISPNEDIMYQSDSESIGHDFKGYGDKIYINDKPTGEKADGELNFLEGCVLDIDRRNTAGKYAIYLKRYNFGSNSRDYIEKDLVSDNPRKFRVICHARVFNGKHVLRVVLFGKETWKFLDEKSHHLDNPHWKKLISHLTLPPGIDAEIRIDDIDVSFAPSRLQIKDIIVTQIKN